MHVDHHAGPGREHVRGLGLGQLDQRERAVGTGLRDDLDGSHRGHYVRAARAAAGTRQPSAHCIPALAHNRVIAFGAASDRPDGQNIEEGVRPWRRSCACSTTIRSTAIRRPTRATEIPRIERYHDGQSTPTPAGDRLQARGAAGLRLGRAGAARVPGGPRAPAGRDLRQGRPGLGLRARAAGRRGRDLPAVLAGLPDRRADRQGAEAEARAHRRHRLRPRRPAGRDRARPDRRRGDLLQQHQRGRARRDDDPGAGAQLHPLLPVGRRGRLEHRRLRRALLRPRGHAGRHGRRRAHRLGRAAAPEAVRGGPALHRPPPPARGGRAGARRHLPPDSVESLVRGLRRGDDQRAAAPRDRAPVRRAS